MLAPVDGFRQTDFDEAFEPLLPRESLTRGIRRRLPHYLIDESCCAPAGIAIYGLSDPRDVRNVRYIGQSAAPRRRLLQHLDGARLWIPDRLPWWIAAPAYKPLSAWIRDLFRDDARLPVMIVSAWVACDQATLAERTRINECLAAGLPILNVQIASGSRRGSGEGAAKAPRPDQHS